MDLPEQTLISNYKSVQQRIANACEKAHRDPNEVQLLAVSKTHPIDDIQALMKQGQYSFGENYVQEINKKYEALGDTVDWQMIGHLQRNKVRYLIDKVSIIHSVDTVRLAQQIDKEATKHDTAVDVLMEINIAQEESKWGFSEAEAIDAAQEIAQFPHVHLKGIMTSAPITEDPEANRPYFKGMKQLAQRIDAAHIPGVEMNALSMGMTKDFEVAVEEGATIVRIGTAIFGARHYANKNK